MLQSRSFHYHIRWSGDPALDWDCFTTAEEAKCCADQMVRSGEDYTVEKFGDDCVRCKEVRNLYKHRAEAGSGTPLETTLIATRYAHTFLFVCPACNLPVSISRIRPEEKLKTHQSQSFDLKCDYCNESSTVVAPMAKAHWVTEWA
jgi:hypothetical protein